MIEDFKLINPWYATILLIPLVYILVVWLLIRADDVQYSTMPPPVIEHSDAYLSSAGELTYSTTDCTIKGNISFPDGDMIYHVVGQKYYDQTDIDDYKGERWFCSEADAVKNGWRKSGV